jgi:hypothetical protein
MSLINNFLLDDPTPCQLLNREEATMWWWNDYYWPTPWMFGPLMTFLFMAGYIGMIWFMVRGRHLYGAC